MMVVVLDSPIVIDEVRAEPRTEPLVGALTRRTVIGAGFATVYAATTTRARGQEASPVADRVVNDMLGPVTVPGRPQRVIAEGNSTLGNMLALGVKPIGASMNQNSLPFFLADQLEGITDVSEESGIDIEKALSLNPDLLIAIWGAGGTGWNLENVERYRQAITTFAYEQNYVYEEDIKKNVTDVALALGVEDRAEAILADFDKRVADLRQAVIDTGFTDKPVTVVRVFDDGEYSIRIGTSESIIFRAIGIPQPEGQRNPEDFSLELSMERLDVLNSAYAVIIYIDNNNTADTAETMLENPVWQSITAVRENRVIFVNSGIWNSIEILGAMGIMDDVENLLLPLAQAG